MTFVFDTNAYSALGRGAKEVLEVYEQADIVYLPFAVIGELLSGFRRGFNAERNLIQLKEFLRLPRVERVDSTARTTEFYGRIHAELKERGSPIPINDVWIAAQSMENGAVLVTYDRHFLHVAGLHLWDRIR
jgi:tRNA(fMet)-specific endonuclease VapC